MSSELPNELQIRSLIEAYADGSIAVTDREQLEELLRHNAAVRDLYRDFFKLKALLVWSLRGRPAQPIALTEGTVPLSGATIQTQEGDSAFSSKPKSPVLGWLGFGSSSEWIVGSLVVMAVMAAFWGLTAGLRLLRNPQEVAPSALSIARLSKNSGCVWANGDETLARHPDLTAGQVLDLRSGVAEVVFESDARLTIEGPARVTIAAEGRCRIEQGRLVAHVPPAAVGFAVETPQSVIVDLGTEFGVIVDDPRSTDLVVFRGEVQVQPAASQPGAAVSPGVRLKAGQSRRIARGELTSPRELLDLRSDLIRDTAHVTQSTRGKQKPVLVSQHKPVTASSEWQPENHWFPAANVVDGVFDDKVTGGQHSWWMAADDLPAQLTIDLEEDRQIVEVRLQNSDAEYSDRGSRLVHLSVSLDGKVFTPIADVELTDVKGQRMIDIEQVTLAAPIRARYVRLDISTFYHRGAALNEVQVFALPK